MSLLMDDNTLKDRKGTHPVRKPRAHSPRGSETLQLCPLTPGTEGKDGREYSRTPAKAEPAWPQKTRVGKDLQSENAKLD